MMNTLEKYRQYLEEQEAAVGTISIYLRYAAEVEKYIAGGATKKQILVYKQKLKDRKVAPATLNLAVVSVNKYLKFAGYENCTVKTEKIQKKKSLENVLCIDEYRKMLNTAENNGRKKYYCIMKTLAQTGIRIGELKYFSVEVLETKKIRVSSKGKTREIYLPDKLIRELKDYCEAEKIKSGVIFRGNTENPIGRVTVYKTLGRIGEMAGIGKEKVHPHSFRHLFAVTYMEIYGNLAELSDILGHSSLETTRIYTLTSAEEKRKRLEQMEL